MKAIKYIIPFLCVTTMLTACTDDDYSVLEKSGTPQIQVTSPGTILMGDTMKVSVGCSDAAGIALSTLKAELCYGDEVVESTTLRTQVAGQYLVKLPVPFLRYVPNGEAKLKLTLQNATTKTSVTTVTVPVERPHIEGLLFVNSDGESFPMTEVADYQYAVTIRPSATAFKGHFQTADKHWLFGSDGSEMALGGTGNVDFRSESTGDTDVTFNIFDYTYGPNIDSEVAALMFTADENTITREMTQGRTYAISGIVNSSWFVDNDFFEDNGDGTYTFIPISGEYTMVAYSEYSFLQVYPGTASAPATLQPDGTGAIWIIGSKGINKPFLDSDNNQGWWTDIDKDFCMAPISEKTYRITLTVGKQLSAEEVNFKFFGQPNWGIEFLGDGSGDYNLTCNNDVFGVGMGKEVNGADNGNIFLREGAVLTEGTTYVFTIDLTAGVANGKLTVTEGAAKMAKEVSLDNATPQTMNIKKGSLFRLTGVVESDWFVDNDFFVDNNDGTYTFAAMTGDYSLVGYNDYKYVQVYVADASGQPATLQPDGTGAIWIIGSKGINKPYLDSPNNEGWWTDVDKDFCLAPIAAGKYRITLTVGKQLSAEEVNFKFFGQPNWGIEFLGDGSGDYNLTCNNDVFGVGMGKEVNGADNGNIFLQDGVELTDGDTYEFTIDLTAGCANGKLSIVKK